MPGPNAPVWNRISAEQHRLNILAFYPSVIRGVLADPSLPDEKSLVAALGHAKGLVNALVNALGIEGD